VQHFSQVIGSPPGHAAAVPPHRALIRIKKKAEIFFWPKTVVFGAVDHSLFVGVSNEEDAAVAESVTRMRCAINHFTARSSG
jgi:hypothetical protein